MNEVGRANTDEELLARYVKGDVRAFELLLSRHRGAIYAFLLRSVRDPAAAEDLFQETFLRVVQRADQFTGQSKLSTWLFTIARNLTVDHARRMRHRRHASLDASPPGSDSESRTLGEQVAGPDRGADRAAIEAQARATFQVALDALPDEQREVFFLRQVDGLAFADIAAILGVPENTAKSRMRYALERLQQALGDYRDYLLTDG